MATMSDQMVALGETLSELHGQGVLHGFKRGSLGIVERVVVSLSVWGLQFAVDKGLHTLRAQKTVQEKLDEGRTLSPA